MKPTSEAAFETAIEAALLDGGYSKLLSKASDSGQIPMEEMKR